MALARTKVWGAEVLTYADLNAEFNSILNNAVSLISPLTAALDLDGQTITLDAAAATSFVSSSGCSWSFTSGAKSGTPATTGSVCNYSAQTFTDSATAGSGTAAAFTAFAIQRPTLAATNASVTTTDAAVWYIPNNVAAGTNETITNSWAIWVDAGNVRFDDDIHWLSGQTFAQRGILAHANTDVRTYTFPDASGTIATTAATILQTLADAAGDTIEASAADTWAKKPAAATVAAHATTMDPWDARVVTLSGGAVTFTDLADADYVGQRVLLLMNDAHIWTDGAVFDVQGGATYTTAAGDWVELVATAVDAFDVTILPSNGGVVASKGRAPITLGTEQATTSGTSIDFTGIPAGVRRITIAFKGVSTNGTDNWLVRLGDAGGIETSGYVGTGSRANASAINSVTSTAGLIINCADASEACYGTVVISLENPATFSWSLTGMLGGGSIFLSASGKSLTAELTQVRITTTGGSNTFDAGAINISYE